MLSSLYIALLWLILPFHQHFRTDTAVKPAVIILEFKDKQVKDSINSDTLFYNSARPLQWDDFKGQVPPNPKSAAVSYSSFAYEGNSRLQHDTLRITLSIEVFLIKSASWVLPSYRNSYALAHEQIHFDITKLVTERFKQKLRQTPLNRGDYDSVIQYQYLESFREMNKLQYRFDEETDHGLNRTEQMRWRDRVNVGLRNNGVLPEELGIEGFYIR
ncbi:hypothetical protein SAMN05660909_03604 [Chitinophaga terrae (ex Kim and Jung 2007)]|uniref:DUF922 domain-containing protein n=1 Tax=Chitinophaga terrae (ex Kim and Jung 2007) TaxID=408074 RepID=A0A1H4EBI3_9BACT|nr:hypothetical protein [Chitinophaga terrae (ex Kim and Jung 2007)]GEP91518.1 hypothetical protein CTE07_31630 [Chitinophaga terrae (ex Kim and Jung 2007)]SEA82159.1 hypothetical protein SAMN05660909_03604 [Chitinophaga terrae (ex Kim and Jung 2007)]